MGFRGVLRTERIACSNVSLLTGLRKNLAAPARNARRSSSSLARALRKIMGSPGWFQSSGVAAPDRAFRASARRAPGRLSLRCSQIGGNLQPRKRPPRGAQRNGAAFELTFLRKCRRPRLKRAAPGAFYSLHPLQYSKQTLFMD
ncbi:MAG: hypothetical protein JWM99_1728 [Verrucomicrobiales bacterium]|nr:hypothetical protein [Verrucomicrobiales bacterium]